MDSKSNRSNTSKKTKKDPVQPQVLNKQLNLFKKILKEKTQKRIDEQMQVLFKHENKKVDSPHHHEEDGFTEEKHDELGPKFFAKMRNKKLKQDFDFEKNLKNKTIQHRINKVLYGNRESIKILANDPTKETDVRCVVHGHAHQDGQGGHGDSDDSDEEEKKSFSERIIIDMDSSWKSIFDVIILVLVGYSCFTTLFYVAFGVPTNWLHVLWDLIVEYMFYLDFFLSFLQEYYDEESQQRIRDLKLIAKQYVEGWFIIDFVSIFPFGVFFNTGVVTKLFRLCRLPRLIKLIDPSRFKKVLKASSKEDTDDKAIAHEYFVMYIYNIFRLVVIAVMITYFIGCNVYFISNEFNSAGDIENDKTFITNFDLESYDNNKHRLIICCYYALTMLSTVGYGDYYPISNLEMVMTVVLMLAGVAFFSFIMGNFMEIIANYKLKMGNGVENKMSELSDWMVQLRRFNGDKPLPLSLVEDITKNLQFYWNHDRTMALRSDEQFNKLPKRILETITSDYLYADVFNGYQRFFNEDILSQTNFLTQFALGMMPRRFDSNDQFDKIIYEENQEVSEMYIITEGIIGLAINAFSQRSTSSFFKTCFRQKGKQIIGDYYVVHGKLSNFIYIAIEEVHAFGINNQYLKQLLEQYSEIHCSLQMSCLFNYNKIILQPMNAMKVKHFSDINRKYRSGDDFRPILKKRLPLDFLQSQAPEEQFWFRSKFYDKLEDDDDDDSFLINKAVPKDRIIGDFNTPNIGDQLKHDQTQLQRILFQSANHVQPKEMSEQLDKISLKLSETAELSSKLIMHTNYNFTNIVANIDKRNVI